MHQNGLPIFPEFRPLRLEDREILYPYLQQLQPEISDRCFTNLFMWQDFYHIQISCHNGNICFFSASKKTPEKEFFFPPLANNSTNSTNSINSINSVLDTLDACFIFMEKQSITPIIRRASEKFVTTYLRDQDKFRAKQDLDISDYIYNGHDLRTLKGKHYHGQRNFIKQFKKKYPDFTMEFLNEENIPECREFCQEWLQSKLKSLEKKYTIDYSSPPEVVVFLKAEVLATLKTLKHFNQLGLTGLTIRINGHIRAFTIGEKLNDKMALTHIEKADNNYRGLIQSLNQAFCQQAWEKCEYINRMEDLGIESLRKAKLALKPHHMAQKYEIVRNA